jgi:hypothetical protein
MKTTFLAVSSLGDVTYGETTSLCQTMTSLQGRWFCGSLPTTSRPLPPQPTGIPPPHREHRLKLRITQAVYLQSVTIKVHTIYTRALIVGIPSPHIGDLWEPSVGTSHSSFDHHSPPELRRTHQFMFTCKDTGYGSDYSQQPTASNDKMIIES